MDISIRDANQVEFNTLKALVGDSTEGLPLGSRVEDRLQTLSVALDNTAFRVVVTG